jgi:MOSC domain-containing protein YiiM
VAPAATTLPIAVDEAEALPGRGLRGDRYAEGAGTFSAGSGSGRALTLIDAAVLEQLGLPGADARRNVVSRGIDLDALVGRRFRIGVVECIGARWCEPCAHLQRLTRPGVLRALVHRGGRRADIVTGGLIRVRDPIET